MTSLRLLILFLFVHYLSMSQDVYFPLKLSVEISSNVQVGVKRSGYTKTYLDYKITNSNNITKVHKIGNSQETTNKQIQFVSDERTKKTNEDKYKSRPKASSLFGGIARAYAGDYTGLLDFGGNVVDHMMTPEYRINEKAIYKTTNNNTREATANSSSSIDNTDKKDNTLIAQISKESTINSNSGFIRFTVSLKNNSERGIKIKNPNFAIYFILKDGTKEVIDFTEAKSGINTLHWIKKGATQEFEINVENQDVQTLFLNYLNSSEIELKLNSLQILSGENYFFVGELEEKSEKEGVRVKYFDGQTQKDFFALIGDTRPTVEELIRDYLKQKIYDIHPENLDSLVVDAVRKINVFENKYSNLKINEIDGNELIQWRKWLVTVYDHDNIIIPFKTTDKLEPGYKISLSYFNAKDILGEHYSPTVFMRKKIRFNANDDFSLDFNLKKGDEIVIENVKLNKLFTDRITYEISSYSIHPKSFGFGRLIDPEAHFFLVSQKLIESNFEMDILPQKGFKALNQEKIKCYQFKPLEIKKEEYFTASDFYLLKWLKGNKDMDKLIDQLLSDAQEAFIKKFIIQHFYNAYDPRLNSGKPIPSGVIPGQGYLTARGDPNLATSNNFLSMLLSENGIDLVRDTLDDISSIKFEIHKDIPASKNKWKCSLNRNTYYSFLSMSEENLPATGIYRSLSIGKHLPRFYFNLDTRISGTPMLLIQMPMRTVTPLGQEVEKVNSIGSLTLFDELQPKIKFIPPNINSNEQKKSDTILEGNKELFEILFDVRIVRRKL